MRKLVAAVLFVATSAQADYYMVEIPSNTMAALVIEQDVPMPAFAEVGSGYVRGIVEADTEYTSAYVANSQELLGMSRAVFQRLRQKCGVVTLSCVQQTLDDPGYGKETFD